MTPNRLLIASALRFSAIDLQGVKGRLDIKFNDVANNPMMPMHKVLIKFWTQKVKQSNADYVQSPNNKFGHQRSVDLPGWQTH